MPEGGRWYFLELEIKFDFKWASPLVGHTIIFYLLPHLTQVNNLLLTHQQQFAQAEDQSHGTGPGYLDCTWCLTSTSPGVLEATMGKSEQGQGTGNGVIAG